MSMFLSARWASLVELLVGEQSCAATAEHIAALSPFPLPPWLRRIVASSQKCLNNAMSWCFTVSCARYKL